MGYVRAFDGIRGVAVFAVMLFHFGLFGAGWIGVQIFFTLSGFLITYLLLQDRHGRFLDFARRFYWRRALRIAPPLCAFLVAAGACYFILGVPASYPSDWLWLATYTGNFARLRAGDLGDPFVHLWSLAVEAQIYLVWPFLLFFVPKRALAWGVGFILILAPVVRWAMYEGLLHFGFTPGVAGKALYVLPLTQLDAFAAGAAIPLLALHKLEGLNRYFGWSVALVAAAGFSVLLSAHYSGSGAYVGSLGYAMYLLSGHEYIWGYSLISAASGLGLASVLRSGRLAKMLENRLLVSLGRISYGVYIYHLPILCVGKAMLSQVHLERTTEVLAKSLSFAIWMAVVVSLSFLSFHWLEMPFLRLKDGWKLRPNARPTIFARSTVIK